VRTTTNAEERLEVTRGHGEERGATVELGGAEVARADNHWGTREATRSHGKHGTTRSRGRGYTEERWATLDNKRGATGSNAEQRQRRGPEGGQPLGNTGKHWEQYRKQRGVTGSNAGPRGIRERIGREGGQPHTRDQEHWEATRGHGKQRGVTGNTTAFLLWEPNPRAASPCWL